MSVGSRGDAQPYVALGLGLKAAGHEVILATHEDFRGFVEEYGLEFRPLAGNPRSMMESPEGKRVAGSGANPLLFARTFARSFSGYADEFFRGSLAACEGAEAIIYAYFALTGYGIARKKNVPGMLALLQPMNRTTRFPLQPSPIFGTWNGIYNWTTMVVAQQLFGQIFKKQMNRWNKKLGLPPMPAGGFYSLADRENIPVLYGYSPTLVPKPRDWRDNTHVTGFWYLGAPKGWTPPEGLLRFLAAGEPPVYVGFGSMTTKDPQKTTRIVVEALRRAGKRGVILSGWGAMKEEGLPDSVYHVESIPHEWLFPRMEAVVHHGGSGSTGAGLKGGVPSFAVPFFADQYFWGDRLARLGVGPKPVPQDRLTVERLTSALKQATGDARMKARAAAVGRRVRGERGVERAVEAFEREVARFKKY
jgi:UDP:flavonoid glycosyltransferase YjiC (YdhE family)